MLNLPPADVDHYDTLNLAPNASHDEIRNAFLALIREHRENPKETDREKIERARRINIAFAVLNEPEKRRAYDWSLGISAGADGPYVTQSSPRSFDRAAALDESSSPFAANEVPDGRYDDSDNGLFRRGWQFVEELSALLVIAAIVPLLQEMWDETPGEQSSWAYKLLSGTVAAALVLLATAALLRYSY